MSLVLLLIPNKNDKNTIWNDKFCPITDRLAHKYATVHLTVLLVNEALQFDMSAKDIAKLFIQCEQDCFEERNNSVKAYKAVLDFIDRHESHFFVETHYTKAYNGESQCKPADCYGTILKYDTYWEVHLLESITQKILDDCKLGSEIRNIRKQWIKDKIAKGDKGHNTRQYLHNGKTCTTKAINAKYLETAIKNILADKVNAYLSAPNTQKSVFDLLKNSKVEEVKTTQKRINSLDENIRGLIDKAVNPKTSKAVAERCEAQANEAIEAQAQHKARLTELNAMLTHIDEIETAFTAKTESLTEDDIFKSYAIARELVGLFVEKIVVDDTNDDIEIIFKN